MVARWRDLLRRSPETTKAISPAAPATFTAEQAAALANAAARVGQQVTGVSVPLPRTDPQVPFGPGVPLFPAAIDPPRPDSGRPEPRFNEYPVTANIGLTADRLVPWKVLRDAADSGGLARRCIEIRKAEVAGLEWAVTITKQAVEAAQEGNSKPRSEVEGALRQNLSSEIARCTRFWEKPDPGQDENFGEWVSKVLEEHLVLDAVAIYPRLTYGGDLYALEVLDGSTIKPLRDHRGGRPAPPNPAFQQILWGFPRGEFVADVDADGSIIGALPSDQLVYKRRNVRAHTPYGYSAVEQALEDVDVWLRRRKWIRDEYTEGTLPPGWITSNGQTGWSPSQVLEYETGLNDTYSGGTAARHRLRVLPPGFDIETGQDVAERYKPEYDLFLIKLMASHFDVTIAELGFTEQGGLGSSGWHEGQADVQQRKGTLPTLRWLQQILTDISRKHLHMPPELEIRFLGLEEEDAAAADAVADARVKSGRITYNEDRDRMGLPRYDFPEADMPIVHGVGGLVVVQGASKLAAGGETVTPVDGPKLVDADGDGTIDSRAEKVKAELGAYRRWAKRNPTPPRPFEFATVTKADAPSDLNTQHVVFAAAGEVAADPKGEGGGAWAGWDRDQDTATVWADRLTADLDEEVDADRLAERWIAQEAVAPQDDEDGAAVAAAMVFLAAQSISLTAPLAAALSGIWVEGWVIGAISAHAVTAGTRAEFNWDIGDDTTARQRLTTAMADALVAFLDDSKSRIPPIADRRLQVFAHILAEAKRRGTGREELAGQLCDALRDDAWARRVALTELTRATAEAARQEYADAGITMWRWAAEPDACPICQTNADAGARTIGDAWPDGSEAPPAHPNCRCHPMPA